MFMVCAVPVDLAIFVVLLVCMLSMIVTVCCCWFVGFVMFVPYRVCYVLLLLWL